jgi:hypothetical protein
VFDGGHLSKDRQQAEDMMDALLGIMRGDAESDVSKNPLVQVHDTVWLRLAEVSVLER